MTDRGYAARGHNRGSRPFRFSLELIAALMLAAGMPSAARAQEPACERAQLVGATSNVDLVVRGGSGAISRVRLAGLQPWPFGWPLEDALPEHARAQVRGAGLCMTVPAVDQGPGGVLLREVWLPGDRGSLAEVMARQGWAEVAPDVERIVPEEAAALRAAEAEARDARRGLWEIRYWLASYAAPNGQMIRIDRRAAPGLDVLATMPEGRQLLDSLATADVPVFMAPEPPEVQAWAHYSPLGRVIWVDRSLIGSDPRNLAVVVAHEAQHAQDHYNGLIRARRTTLADEEACFASEIRAFGVELSVWRQLFGSGGSPAERSRFERQENILLEVVGDSPDELEFRVRRLYRWNCRARTTGEPEVEAQ